jgi:hypothetical protein
VTPYFRLNTPLTRAWAVNREARHKLARWLAHQFAKTGVAVCTDTLSVVAWVNPMAQIKFAVLGRWREYELPEKVKEQAARGGFIAATQAVDE